MTIKITWWNYGKEFDNLHRKIKEIGWVKPNDSWVFITKLKQGSLKGLDYDLILEKWWFLPCVVGVAEPYRERKEEKMLLVDFRKMIWNENVQVVGIIDVVDKIHFLRRMQGGGGGNLGKGGRNCVIFVRFVR
jgi:hypothetical protein